MKKGLGLAPQKDSQVTVLNQILQDALSHTRSGKMPPLAIFDLDSTLFDLSGRVTAIVNDFKGQYRALYPDQCGSLENLSLLKSDWGLKAPLERIGIDCNGSFYEDLQRYWTEAFFSNRYLGFDTPMPGAVTFVQRLHQTGTNIMYLTGRDIPRMLEGTRLSLKEHSFPLEAPSVELILKPDACMDDALFKAQVIRDYESHHGLIWFFENEPVNLHLVERECPNVKLVFIDSAHSGREEPRPHLEKIVNWMT